jgi:chromosome segregation ATPase
MANFRFFNIAKANAEIIRLEGELVEAKEVAANASQNASEIADAAEANAAKLSKADVDLTEANTKATALSVELAGVKTELATAKEKLANPSDQIKQAASRKAAEITAQQGQPPITAGTGTTGSKDILSEYAAIKDPVAKIEWYRKNKEAYNAAWRAANPRKPIEDNIE